MGYLTTKQRAINALEHLKGRHFRMEAVVAIVNKLPDGKPRMKGTITVDQAGMMLRGTGLVEKVGNTHPTTWRVVE